MQTSVILSWSPLLRCVRCTKLGIFDLISRYIFNSESLDKQPLLCHNSCLCRPYCMQGQPKPNDTTIKSISIFPVPKNEVKQLMSMERYYSNFVQDFL